MKDSIELDFKGRQPRAIVLDDNDRSRISIARELKHSGFIVQDCETVAQFFDIWAPGMFDLIVADWQLSERPSDHGDKVLERVRAIDWDVPFVLISGKLDEHHNLSSVLQVLLDQGQARFVVRGDDVFGKIREEALQLMERRDSTLLKVILALRDAADEGASFRTTTGQQAVKKQLADLVASPVSSHDSLRPLSNVRSARFKPGE